MAVDLTRMRNGLARWAAAHYGSRAEIDAVEPMPGHSGISIGFDVLHDDESGSRRTRLIVRVPPPGVRRQGNTDVLRQVPLLRALAAEGIPVANVRHWGDDETWFGLPYLIVERLPGRSLSVFEPDPSFDLSPTGVATLFEQAVSILVRLHQVDWRVRLEGWSPVRTLTAEIRAWEPILARALDPDWIEQGCRLAEQLLNSCPSEPPPGLVHGDYYSNNWMFDGQRLTGVIDWEIAGVGPSLLDLGWLCMWYDPESWGPTRRGAMAWAPSPDDLVSLYQETFGRPVLDAAWYRALAAYRFAAITALNLRLHRTGRRPDSAWEVFGESFPYLLDRARELLLRRARAVS